MALVDQAHPTRVGDVNNECEACEFNIVSVLASASASSGRSLSRFSAATGVAATL